MIRSSFRTDLSKMAFSTVAVLCLSAVSPSVSFAIGSDEQRAACTPDVFRLCSSEIPNVDHIIVCMNVKRASLSPACKAAFTPPRGSKGVSTVSEPR